MATSGNPAQNSGSKEALDEALATALPKGQGERNSDEYRIHLPVFEGPLDLLLHLIRKEQIDIHDIPVARVCESYLEYLRVMQTPDVNLAGEFMVMAATLILMKSLVLLPRDEEKQEDDPRLPLVQQLLEYERFKKAAEELDSRDWMFRDIYPRPMGASADVMPVEALLTAPLEPVDPFTLLMGLKVALSRTVRKPLQIAVDPISIKEKVVQMGDLLESANIIDFVQLLPPKDERKPSDIVTAFFAVLELARLKFIEIMQHENFGPIHIRGVRPMRELNVGLLDQF